MRKNARSSKERRNGFWHACERGTIMTWGILLGLIVVAAAIKRCTGHAARSRTAERTVDVAKRLEDQIAATQADPEIINHILFLESVAIQLARNPNPYLQNHTPNHGLIRISAWENGVEFYASTFNVHKGLEEFRTLLQNKSEDYAETFLTAAGFQGIVVTDFLRYISEFSCELGVYGSISVKYAPSIPAGTGNIYYCILRERLLKQWSDLPFEFHSTYIDVFL